MRSNLKWLVVCSLLLLSAVGCSSKHKLVAGAPDWVNQGSGAFDEAGAKIFYGVGAVSGISSQTLAVQAADQRARADIAWQLETYVTGLARDFQSGTSAPAGQAGTEQQHLEQTVKNVTQVSVRGARVQDHWRDPETNTVYSLVKLNLDDFKQSLDEVKDVDPALQGFVRQNADQAFERMKTEEKK